LEEAVYNLYYNIHMLQKIYHMNSEEMSHILGISKKKLKRIKKCSCTGLLYDFQIKKLCDYFNISPDLLFLSRFI